MALHRRPQQQTGYQKGKDYADEPEGKTGKGYADEPEGKKGHDKRKGYADKHEGKKGKGDVNIDSFVQAARLRMQQARTSPYGPTRPELRRSLQFCSMMDDRTDDEAAAEAWACISLFRYIRSCHQDASSEKW